MFGKISLSALLVALFLSIAGTSSAKNVCAYGPSRSVPDGQWSSSSYCQCGTSIAGWAYGWGDTTPYYHLWLYAKVRWGNNFNEVWNQVRMVNQDGKGTWVYAGYDAAGGAAYNMWEFWGGGDLYFKRPSTIRSVCAN